MLRRILISLAVVASLATAATPALARATTPGADHVTTVTASGHGITATYAYRGSVPNFTAQRLTIRDASRTLYSAPVSYHGCAKKCWPQIGTSAKAVQLASLDGAGSADVLLNLYTGGAHCCSVVEVFRPSAALGGRYVRSATHDFGDPGYRLKRLGGVPRFVTANDAFAYRFTDFAASGLPVQVLSLQGIRFVDVTGRYPALVRADAARWLKAFHAQARSRYQDSVGVIAAWAADEYTLGLGATARQFLTEQAHAGHLNSGYGAGHGGMRFVSALERFLTAQGYGVHRLR